MQNGTFFQLIPVSKLNQKIKYTNAAWRNFSANMKSNGITYLNKVLEGGAVLWGFPRDNTGNGLRCNISFELKGQDDDIRGENSPTKCLGFITLTCKGKLKERFVEDQNTLSDLLMGVKNSMRSPGARTRDAGVRSPRCRRTRGGRVLGLRLCQKVSSSWQLAAQCPNTSQMSQYGRSSLRLPWGVEWGGSSDICAWVGQSSVSWRSKQSHMSQKRRGGFLDCFSWSSLRILTCVIRNSSLSLDVQGAVSLVSNKK